MAIESKKHPYELLVRWKDGTLYAAHVAWEVETIEDGKRLSIVPTAPQPVDIGAGDGFPLLEILTQTQADALARATAMEAERDAAIVKARATGEALQIERAANQVLRRQMQGKSAAAPDAA